MFDIVLPKFHYLDIENKGLGDFSYSPNFEFLKNESGYSIVVDLPGVSRSDIDVSVEGKILSLTAKRESTGQKRTYKKSWSIGDSVLVDEISARYESGVLFLDVPIKIEKKRKIEIN
jgi:HSP20 family protein